MRLVHTSDWHVGATLAGKERTQEHAVFLEELEEIVRGERIDAVLIAGDIFDHPNPGADAEKLVFDFFRKMAEQKIDVVFIAGNHDSGERIEGKARLLQLVQIHAFGKPARNTSATLLTRKDELLIIAALPFAGELRLLDWDQSANQHQGEQKSTFAERIKQLLSLLAKTHFKPEAVNILMAHLTVDGAVLSGSEKNLRMSDAWTIPSPMLPAGGDYLALGHIHKAQELPDAPVRTAYSGSPLYIDFGEEKDQKGIYILDAAPGKLLQSSFLALSRIKPVKTIRSSFKEFELHALKSKDFSGHVKAIIHLDEEDSKSGVAEHIRRLLPQTSIVLMETPQPQQNKIPDLSRFALDPVQAYRMFLESQSRQLTEDLSRKLQELMEEAGRATD